MDRRTALKNITLASGYAIAAPTMLSVLHSCKSDVATWIPSFLSETQGHTVKHLVDIILPTSNIPGAIDVNVPEFIDLMYKDVESEDKQNTFLKGADMFAAKFETVFDKKALKGTKKEFEQLLETYFKISSEQQSAIFTLLNSDESEVSDQNQKTYYIYKFLTSVRGYTLYGYYTSEKVGEGILAYDPVPGPFIPCAPIEELTGGKSWSL